MKCSYIEVIIGLPDGDIVDSNIAFFGGWCRFIRSASVAVDLVLRKGDPC